MNDKELLQAAARAAGYKVLGLASKWIVQGVSEHALLYRNERGGSSVFDPLRDPGDALRLAVQLEMRLEISAAMTAAFASNTDVALEHSEGDPIAATMRAITRAAAEIERAKT